MRSITVTLIVLVLLIVIYAVLGLKWYINVKYDDLFKLETIYEVEIVVLYAIPLGIVLVYCVFMVIIIIHQIHEMRRRR